MKPYPLAVIDYANGNEEPVGFYSRGHHGEKEFRAACIHHIHETEGTTESIDLEREVMDVEVCQTYWRSVPMGTGDDIRFVESESGVQGAYPVTFLRVEL